MTFSNRGRIHPAAGPEGHTHSIYQLNDISAGGDEGDTLVVKNGVWVATNALPYSMAAGQYLCPALSITAGGNSGAMYVNFTTDSNLTLNLESKFSISPIVTLTIGNGPGGSIYLVPRVVGVNTGAFNIYLYNVGAATATVAAGMIINWTAIQMTTSARDGMISSNPNE